MRPQVKAFRDTASQTCKRRTFPFRRFMGEYGLEDILIKAEADNASPQQIAQAVLLGCCVSDGKFNRFAVGVLAVMTYLNEQLGHLGQGEEQAFRDLGSILQQSPTAEAVSRWMQTHYPEPG